MKNRLKQFLPDASAVVFFIAIAFLYFMKPVTEGLVIAGHDHTGGVGAGIELNEYRERTGERSRWTNALFGGMPSYQLSPSYDSTDHLVRLGEVYQLGLPNFTMYIFIMLLGFYILLRAFNFKAWMAALGAVLWAFSSYFLIIIGAGHIWKLMALAYIPPTIAGLVLCYRGRYLWGGVVTAFFLALQILSNHVQMSYYFIPVMVAMSLAYLLDAVREKQLARWGKATVVLIVAAVIGIAINLSNLYHTYEYSKESMRAKSELQYKAKQHPENQTSSGLERDYITQWSYGIGETWTLLVPNVKGGASVPLTMNKTAMKLANPQYMPVFQSLTQYWGEQPGTSGPVYVGAFVLFLFVFSLFILKGPMKWCLLVVTLFAVMLSWGKNFMGLTDFFLDYVPMYDKFRTVSSILVVAEFTIPLLAMLGLKAIVEDPDILKKNLRWFYTSFALTGGVAFLFAVMPDVFWGNYMSTSEMAMLNEAVAKGYIPQEMLGAILDNLDDMRRAMVTNDAWRSVAIIVVGCILLLLYNIKKMKASVLTAGLIVLCLFDMWQVDKRYVNDAMFSKPRQKEHIVPKTAADEQILKDPDLYYRVMNLSSSPFNENNTSYYHKSIGGYHAAKMRRYQEMIEEHIASEMTAYARATIQTRGELDTIDGDSIFPVLNMLNMKYAILGGQGNESYAFQNPHANGNVWFVDEVRYVHNADEEILSLHEVSPKKVAVVQETFREKLNNMEGLLPADSTRSARLTHYEANALSYEVSSEKGGVLVFSDIYYPGWQAKVDGESVEIARADYILRTIYVTPGKHVVEFKFDPQSLHTTELIANIALVLLMLTILFLMGYEVLRRRKLEKE